MVFSFEKQEKEIFFPNIFINLFKRQVGHFGYNNLQRCICCSPHGVFLSFEVSMFLNAVATVVVQMKKKKKERNETKGIKKLKKNFSFFTRSLP